MPLCVNECMEVVDGILGPKLDPAGGITCGPDGLTAAAAIAAADDAALAAAAAAQADADAAQADADTALDRVPNKVRWGFASGTTNGAGDIDFAHGLGAIPSAVVLQPHAASASHVWTCVVENLNSSNVNVRIHDTTTGAAMPGQAVGFSWFAAMS
jgi:hypothetical protein